MAEEQLAAQEKSLRLQLDEQRAEASKARYLTATADFVTAVEIGANTFRRGGDFEDVFIQMESARVRMGFDSDSPLLIEELQSWPLLVWELCKAAKSEHDNSIDEGVPFTTLVSATTAVTTVLSRWPAASAPTRVVMLDELRARRQSAQEAADVYVELLYFSRSES